MKKINRILLIILPFLSIVVNGQNEIAKCKIAAVARYTPQGTELRWIPDNKTILHLGFANSFTIERSDSGSNKFEAITTVKAFSNAVWDSLIAIEKNPESKSNLEMAADFLFANKESGANGISLDKGIAELNDQKSKEDLVYAVFVLTAIKDGKVAEALGLGFLDNSVKVGSTYIYRIKLNAESPIYNIENGEVTVKASMDPDKYKNEVFVYPGDKQLSFAWSSTPELSGYFAERATEEDTVFKSLNTTPFYASKGSEFNGTTNGSFMDDSLINYKWYSYRFYGINAFGDKIMFAEVKGMPRDLTPPDAPIITQPKHMKAKEVLVEWSISGDLSDLRGFIVGRSDKDSGDFKILHPELLSEKSRNYVDTTFNSDGINYYIVYAIDTTGNISSSYPGYVALVDSTPPVKPQIISAIIDSLGVVTLTMELGKEKDLKGYKLFKANSPDHEFSVIEEAYRKDLYDSTFVKTVFTDTVTLHSLTPKIFYRVKALDFNYNQSEFSDIAEVVRPDTIPPVTPLVTNVVVAEKHVELYFVPSSSEDVKEHLLYRKAEPESDWELLKTFTAALTQFIDTNVTTGVTYYYSIRARDLNGLYSEYASSVYGKPYDTGIRPPVENLAADVEKEDIILTWDYSPSIVEPSFIIYKKDKKGFLMQYDVTINTSYTDKSTDKENYYAIKAVTKDGGQSKISEIVGKIIE